MVRRLIPVPVVAILFSLFLLLALGAPVRADGPDFSNVTDILQGRRMLFPEDDFAVSQFIYFQGTNSYLLQTANDTVNARFPYTSSTDSFDDSGYFDTVIARMFDLPRDVVVNIFKGHANIYDQKSALNQNFPNTLTGHIETNVYAAADMTGDDLTDIAFLTNTDSTAALLQAITAADPGDPTQGFFYGTPVELPQSHGFAMAAGDFDGDGISEVAVAYSDPFSSPTDFSVLLFHPQVTLNAQNQVTAFTWQQVGSVSIPACCPFTFRLVAGHFTGLPTPQLALIYSNNNQPVIQPISVTPVANSSQFTLTLANALTLNQDSTNWMAAQSGYLDFFENTEQVILTLQGASINVMDVLTFDSQLNVTLANTLDLGTLPAIPIELALGNFDQQITDTAPLYLEAAILTATQPQSCGSDAALTIQTYHIDPANNYALTAGNASQVSSTCYNGEDTLVLSLATGDTQERSLMVGAPSKLTAQHVQPQVILGAPPMHVDYVSPGNSAPAEVFNVSAVPNGFYSSYQTAVSNQAQSSHQGTTSYTNAVKASVSAGVKLGDPLVGSITAKAGVNAGRMTGHFIAKQYGSYSSVSFDASTNTGFDDQVWFNSESHNIYIYPLIGQKACPSDDPSCATPGPLTVMFSGPSQQSQSSVGGSALEWYQPIQEVGNLFSYPWNFAQLKADEGDIDLLTSSTPTSFSTDSSTHTAFATWAGQNSQNTTTGNTTNISWGANASLTEKAGILGGIVGNQKFSYNGSKVIGTLHTSTTKLGQSTGIGILKPGTFPNPPLYEYPIFPYIFGDHPLTGTVQTINLGTQIQTDGILRAGFTADPTDPSAGAWWQGTYTLPDVAVAHAARWNFQIYTPSAPMPNCIPLAVNVRNNDCALFNAPQSDIWTSEFYWMKGLLITPAGVNGEGPQIDQATAGDQIQLSSRIYNDSLADVPSDSSIVVQFYAQPWDPNALVPLGNAFLIDTVNVPPLPGFNSISSGGTTPNWTLATTSNLDTSSLGDQYLAFWVVTYIKDVNGNLVPEMPSHGLVSIPPTLDSIASAAPYLQPYSNNIGFYKSLFYIQASNTPTATIPTQAGLKLNQVKVSKSQLLLGGSAIISGVVHSKQNTDGLDILFYDGNPDKNGTLFDVDKLTHIRANGSHLVKTVYHATTCGDHTLTLRGMEASIQGQAQVNVTINPLTAVRSLNQVLKPLNLPKGRSGGGFKPLLSQARKAFKQGDNKAGLDALHQFQTRVQAQRGNKIPTDAADTMLSMLDQVFTCVR